MSSTIPVLSPSKALFSNVQERVLALLFGNPERSFYTSEILKTVKSGIGAVDRELSRLRESGLVTAERRGRQVHYKANHASPIYRELQRLVLKTAGLVDPLADALLPHASKIAAAFVFGSMAKGTQHAGSDVDLMVIGEDLDQPGLYEALQTAELKLHRPVRPLFMSTEAWQRAGSDKDSFVHKISEQPTIPVLGSLQELHP